MASNIKLWSERIGQEFPLRTPQSLIEKMFSDEQNYQLDGYGKGYSQSIDRDQAIDEETGEAYYNSYCFTEIATGAKHEVTAAEMEDFANSQGLTERFTVLDVIDEETILVQSVGERWTCEAHLPQLNADGTIEWAYSSEGYFADREPSIAAETDEINFKTSEETKKQTFIEFLRSVDEDTETDWLFDGDVIVGGEDMEHALVWEWGADISEYGYEKYKALLDSEYEITVVHGNNGYSVIEIFCDDDGLGAEFFAAAAGYINSTEYDKIFIEPPAPEKQEQTATNQSATLLDENRTAKKINLPKEDKNMAEIKARVTPIEEPDKKAKGIATVRYCGVEIPGIMIYEGKDGLYPCMPARKLKDGKYEDMVFPKNKEFYAELKNTVIEAYHEARNGIKLDIGKLAPDELKISVSNFRENTYENNIKGDCQVTINDNLVLKGVKLVQTNVNIKVCNVGVQRNG